MRSRWVTISTVALGCIALALVILILGRLSASSGGTQPILSSAPASPAAPDVTAVAATRCDPGMSRHGVSNVVLRGACTGVLTDAFGCVAITDDLYLSGRRVLDPEHVLYLTVNVESYRNHPGDYQGAQTTMQVTGPVTVERWSDYAVPLHVNADRSVDVASADLVADPGTGSAGTVSVSGSLRCATP
jgi:hypothetical protein